MPNTNPVPNRHSTNFGPRPAPSCDRRAKAASSRRPASHALNVLNAVKPSDLADRVGEGLATFEGIIVPTQAQKTAVRQMHSLLKMGEKQPEGQQRRAYRYLHHSGAGKSTCAKILEAFVESEPGYDPATKPVLHVTLSTTGTPKSLASSILAAMGDNYSTRGEAELLLRRVQQGLKDFKVKLLIIDELNHFKQKSLATDAANTIKNILSLGWPATLVPALERSVSNRSRSRRNVRYTGVVDYLPALGGKILPDIVRSAIDDALAPIAAAAGKTPPEQIGMMEAAERLKRPLKLLAPARREGRLRTHICLRANRIFPTLDRAEVEYLLDFSSNRISVEKASVDYDLPAYAMPLIADAGRIALENHPFLVAYHSDPQLHSAEYRRFKNAVRAAAVHTSSNQPDDGVVRNDVTDDGPATGSSAIADPVSIHRAARAIGGGLKPWGEIFDRLLSGNIPFAITGDRVRRIVISKQDAISLRHIDLTSVTPSLLPPTCSQRDALEILNLPGKHAEILKTLAGADDNWEMPWEAVLDLARTRITLAEMCARTGIHATSLENLMEDVGCPRLDCIGWLRSSALPTLQQITSERPESGRKRTVPAGSAFRLLPREPEVQKRDH